MTSTACATSSPPLLAGVDTHHQLLMTHAIPPPPRYSLLLVSAAHYRARPLPIGSLARNHPATDRKLPSQRLLPAHLAPAICAGPSFAGLSCAVCVSQISIVSPHSGAPHAVLFIGGFRTAADRPMCVLRVQ